MKNKPQKPFMMDGFHTGDVVTIDEEGNMEIVDRTKGLIKSGGELISSVELENALMGHEGIFEAAVVSIPDRPSCCLCCLA
jgi:fatty-acyl-CoA synthase